MAAGNFGWPVRLPGIALVGAAAAWPPAALAHQPEKLPHIGVLVSASSPHPFADAFWRGLHALGYSEGKNIKVEFRYTEARSDRAEEFAEEFVRFGVNVIVAHYAIATTAAMAATRTIPIVMVHGAPLQMGVIDSLARPGGNVTGLSAATGAGFAFEPLLIGGPSGDYRHGHVHRRSKLPDGGASW